MVDDCGALSHLKHFRAKHIYHCRNGSFNIRSFSEKCHHQSDIMLIIRTEDDHVFGGYTSVGWKDMELSFKYGHDTKAFVFTLRCQCTPSVVDLNVDGCVASLWRYYASINFETTDARGFKTYCNVPRVCCINSFKVTDIEIFAL